MKEYIELGAAIKKIRNEGIYGEGHSDEERENDVIGMLEQLTTADVVKVVRCKDCQEWKELLLDNLPAGVGDCRCNLMTTDAHFYCANGERRSE